jgi:TPR repeat protein
VEFTMVDTMRGLLAFVVLGGLLAGCGTSPLLKGNEAFHEGDYVEAASRWKPLAEAGHAGARHNLGVLNEHLGDSHAAAGWWEQAVALEFVPSMLRLAELRLAQGSPEEARALYRRAARWGSSEAVTALESMQEPVPHADLLLAHMRRFQARQGRVAKQIDRSDPNEFLNRMLDEQAAKAEHD